MRISRSILSVPASNPRMIEKGLASSADIAFLDLEDAVAPNMKAMARTEAIDAINHGDWQGKPRAVRVNQVGSPYFARDIVGLVELRRDRRCFNPHLLTRLRARRFRGLDGNAGTGDRNARRLGRCLRRR